MWEMIRIDLSLLSTAVLNLPDIRGTLFIVEHDWGGQKYNLKTGASET